MVSQRGYGVKDADAGITKKIARSKPDDKPQAAKTSKAKLSYKEEHALKTLPDEIAKLERDMEKLNTALSDPDLYSRDPAMFEKYSKALEGRQALLDKAETRWLELEELKQSLS